MTKKVKISCIDSLITAICKTLPPTSKEDLKTINQLKIFLENNSEINENTKKTELCDELFNKTLENTYLRKDLCNELLAEYNKWSQNIRNSLSREILEQLEFSDEKGCLVDTSDLEEIANLNKESLLLLNRMKNILMEENGRVNSEKGVIKYFKSL